MGDQQEVVVTKGRHRASCLSCNMTGGMGEFNQGGILIYIYMYYDVRSGWGRRLPKKQTIKEVE